MPGMQGRECSSVGVLRSRRPKVDTCRCQIEGRMETTHLKRTCIMNSHSFPRSPVGMPSSTLRVAGPRRDQCVGEDRSSPKGGRRASGSAFPRGAWERVMVLRASPPPNAARPVSRGRPVEFTRLTAWGFPCSGGSPLPDMPSSLPRWPAGSDRSWVGLFQPLPFSRRLWPSPCECKVGAHIGLFEACSTFTHVTACRFAAPPRGTFVSKAPTASLPPPPLR